MSEKVEPMIPMFHPSTVCQILSVNLPFLNQYARRWLPNGPALPAAKRGAASRWSMRDVATLAVGLRLKSLQLRPELVTEICHKIQPDIDALLEKGEPIVMRYSSDPCGSELVITITLPKITNHLR